MTKYQYYEDSVITTLEPEEIYVFGSNEAGRHGSGAAKQAREFGARWGHAVGMAGNTYAIPTKDKYIRTLSLDLIRVYVDNFKDFAYCIDAEQEEYNYAVDYFLITRIGCGLAGYKDSDIAPMFKGSPSNCKFHISWKDFLEDELDLESKLIRYGTTVHQNLGYTSTVPIKDWS